MNVRMSCLFAIVLIATFPIISQAQPTYSFDFQGPTTAGGPGTVNEGDILTPMGAGTIPPPAVVIPVGATGLGLLPTIGGISEVDALSYGNDLFLTPNSLVRWEFSVDEFALGIATVPGPSVTTEGAAGAGEASADIYRSTTGSGPLPVPPAIGPFGANTGIWDGNGGLTPFAAPGLNAREPHPAVAGLPDTGDNVDAWEADAAPGYPVYFSLDASFADVLEGGVAPPNSGTAMANGFVGGDVLVTTTPGGPPAVYAPAGLLGLSPLIPDVDDLDALVLWDDGDAVYQPTTGPYSWLAGTDMLLFSVRRDSAVIGTPDAIFGALIAPGDILVPFLTTGGFFAPGIMIPAELLGLTAFRSFPGVVGDDLDALDVRAIPEPSALSLLATGGLVLSVTSRCRRKRQAACWQHRCRQPNARTTLT
jgi:hypothetical protein